MKMKPEDVAAISAAVTPLLTNPVNRNLWANYKAKGLTERRFVWDTLWASGFNPVTLYHYCTDANITTALLHICKPYMTA